MSEKRKKVLVIGGGFGGIKAALELCKSPDYHVTLLSDRSNFRYYPTLYRAATGGRISASQIPLGEIFAGKPVELAEDTAETLDRNKSLVIGKSGREYAYDKLIISLGVVTNYFGIKGLEKYAYGIKSVEEAKRLRQHLHKLLLDEGKPDLNYVVIGGGPTGVELAGALPGYLSHIMRRHGIKKRSLHIDLVEAAPRLMPRMPKSYSKAVAKRLRKLGVKLYLGQTVEAETADALMVSGHPIKSHTVVWTAGVTNSPFFKANEFSLTEHGKASVNQYLQAEENIYVIGDNADTPYSGMAQTALYDARFVANNLLKAAKGQQPKTYKPKEPDYVTPVGPHWAAAIVRKVSAYGWLGYALRRAADFIAYHDYEPWWQASQHWVAQAGEENDCQLCSS